VLPRRIPRATIGKISVQSECDHGNPVASLGLAHVLRRDRDAKDKIYSKWVDFSTTWPSTPRSTECRRNRSRPSIHAAHGLEVAYRTLVDTGYHAKPFDRERASVIIGASGGIGDVGMQYGLRSELPRFVGDLASDVAERLPEWTETPSPESSPTSRPGASPTV